MSNFYLLRKSTSSGKTFSPPVLMRPFCRPMSHRLPALSIHPVSPVSSHPFLTQSDESTLLFAQYPTMVCKPLVKMFPVGEELGLLPSLPIRISTWGAGLPTKTPPEWLPDWFLGSWSFGLLRAMNVRDEQASVIPV